MADPDRLDVLVVGWFPSAGDPGAGRFVADQVAALRATGRVRPWVATFEPIPLFGDERLRSAAEAATERHLTRAIESEDCPFAEGAAGPPRIPVARLGFAAGETKRTGAEHGLIHREVVLSALVNRLDRPAWRLVHGHVGYPEGAAAARVARRLGVPFVLTEHATYLATIFGNRTQRARYAETIRSAARVVTVTRMLARELEAEFRRDVPDLPERLVVIPNAIAIEDFPVVGPEQRASAELLWVGYRKPIKGIETLLDAFARVRRVRPDARLRLIGSSVEPTNDRYWRNLADRLGLGESVSIEGPTDRAGVAAAMARATLFVHPSNRETFGVVAAEALATGLPVVATDSGGVTEVLGPEPERFGALVPRGDPIALAEAILATLERRAAFDPWVLRRWVEEHYAAPVVARRLVDLYAEVLAVTPPAAGRRVAVGAAAVPPERPAPPTDRIVIVGLHRSVLDRSRLTQRRLLDRAVIVSTGDTGGPSGRWVLAGPGSDRRLVALLARGWRPPPARTRSEAVRQAVRAGSGWLRSLGRRGMALLLGRDDTEVLIDELRRILADALAGEPGSAARSAPEGVGAPLLVCVTGLDHLVAAPFIAAGTPVAPGGLAWLADRIGVRAPARSALDERPLHGDSDTGRDGTEEEPRGGGEVGS